MKEKYISAPTVGADFEAKIDEWSLNAGLEFYSDKTLDNAKRRKKDISTDRCFVVNSEDVFIELKTTGSTSMSYTLYHTQKKHRIKFEQICKMDYIILEFRPNKPLVISKKQFLTFAANYKFNSINYKNALKIGFEIEGMEWLNDIKRD